MAIVPSGTEAFIPELWNAALLEPFKANTVFGQTPVVSTEYAGQISQLGDTVHVTSIGKPTINDYDAAADLEIEDLKLSDNSLAVDQGKTFGFYVNDVFAVQAAGVAKDAAIRVAGAELADNVDKYVGSIIKSDAASKIGNTKVFAGAADKAGTTMTAYEALVKLHTALNMKNVPQTGRFVVIGAKTHEALLLDPRFTNAAAYGNNDAILNGFVGRALGFDILVSNNIPTVSNREVLCAGMHGAVSLAVQINKTEAQRAEKRFADLVKGLMIYGAKAFNPDALATLEADYAPAAG